MGTIPVTSGYRPYKRLVADKCIPFAMGAGLDAICNNGMVFT